MDNSDVIRLRLHNQRLATTTFKTAEEVVSWLGAVQAQDYAGAKWALAQRINGITDAEIEQAFTDGKILRTHVMRPTWHFVKPEDIRWMLELTAPRVFALTSYMDRQLGLDQTIFNKSNTTLVKALNGGKQLTRTELVTVYRQARINVDGLRMGQILGHAEVDGIICSGGKRGKQFTYALLAERAPQARTLKRDEALAELASRYFISHGPATLRDFVWWSGLTTTDARKGLDTVKSQLIRETVNDQTYWFTDSKSSQKQKSPAAYLFPNYDEYIIGYTDRSAIFDIDHTDKLDSRGNVLFQYTLALDGQIAGTWKRTLKKNEVAVEITPFISLTKAQKQAVTETVQHFGRFLGLPISLLYKEHTSEQRPTRSLQ
jgi:DNA glycosylase AlkZ-like